MTKQNQEEKVHRQSFIYFISVQQNTGAVLMFYHFCFNLFFFYKEQPSAVSPTVLVNHQLP